MFKDLFKNFTILQKFVLSSKGHIILKKYSIYFLSFGIFFIIYMFVVSQLNTYNKLKQDNLRSLLSSNEFNNIKNYVIKNLKSPYREYQHIVKNNDTIEKILVSYNVINEDIKNIVSEIRKKKLSNIYSKTLINIVIKEENKKNRVIRIDYPINEITTIEVKRDKNKFNVKENILRLTKKEVVISNSIKKSLYSSAIDSSIEPNVIVEFANIFGFEVDFQRDIRKGDRFEIYYERYLDEDNIIRKSGKIIYASMFVNDKEISLYNFNYKNRSGYYDVNGKSVIKTLMKTPINGARLSSSFGMRKHPILGFNRLHKGTDFAARSGTPIMASGSGTVTRARWCGGGGNCVKIKHNSTYETIYAHMKGFAKGIKKGKKVRQGQIIGYVGSTGMSTGPHLHYEVVKNGKKINSQTLKLPTGKGLNKEDRNKFEVERIKIDVRLANLRK